MDHIHNTSRGRHRVPKAEWTRLTQIRERWDLFVVLVLVSFAVIFLGTWWAFNQFEKNPQWHFSDPTVTTTTSPTTPSSTPTTTPAEPICAPGEVWSKHASKCYIPKELAGNRIDAIPSTKSPRKSP